MGDGNKIFFIRPPPNLKIMANEKRVNQIGRKIGMALINSGTKMVRSAFDLTPKVYSSSDIQDTIKPLVGLTQPSTVSCSDGKYNVVDWETWEWIKDLDLIDQMLWIENYHDCDNFAFHFASRASALYLLNSCGVAFGALYNDAGKWIGNHAFNIIAVDKGNGLEFILYEPMNDNFATIRGQKTRLAHGWNYVPNWIIFY